VSRFRSFVIRFGAPLIVVLGISAVYAGRRGLALKASLALWADSLDRGSGPLSLSIPFLPAYLEGRRIGSLDSVRLERHEPRTVDSLRLVVDLSRAAAGDDGVRHCAFQLATFDPGAFHDALECAADTAGLVPFGRVVFLQGGDAKLYVARRDLACAPWADHARDECIGQRVRLKVQRDIQRARDRVRAHRRVR
jgi:hypothetical protein